MLIYIDGDACPVKAETYKVAKRHDVKTLVVANNPMLVPKDDLVEMVFVRGGFDAADDWIAERAGAEDVVITADIPLAGRSLRNGARVLGPRGYPFTEDMIGEALATRGLMEMLRQGGEIAGGPRPFAKEDRSRFLGKLDEMLHAIRRNLDRQRKG